MLEHVSHGMLTDVAFRKLIDRLEGFGNKPNTKHQQALRAILGSYSRMATGNLTGRQAFPLFTGGGKTQSIVAWLQAVQTITKQAGGGVSVSVCASQVEALCELKRDLIGAGIPEDLIALVHSYEPLPAGMSITSPYAVASRKYATEASTPFDLVDSRPILLLTHNRVKGKGGIEQFMQFQGEPRDLMIWDESLIKAEGHGVQFCKVDGGLEYWKRVEHSIEFSTPIAEETYRYISKALEDIRKETERQKREPQSNPRVLRLPELNADEIRAMKVALGNRSETSEAREFLEVSQHDLRVFLPPTNQGGVVRYDILVPPELENIVILDASHNIRRLAHLDGTIKQPAVFPQTAEMVSYRDLEVRQLKHNAGRRAIEKAMYRKHNAAPRPLTREIVDYVKDLPADEGVLFFTFKPKAVKVSKARSKMFSCAGEIQAAMEAAGIDPEAKLPDGRDRFGWLTHGSETSTSKYRYCKHQVWVGVLYRSEHDIGASAIGQKDDIRAAVPADEIRSLMSSEIAYRFHQGFGRGPCRVVEDGVAGAQTVLVVYSHPNYRPEELVQSAMPGVVWKEYFGKYITADTKVDKFARRIAEYLRSIERKGVRKISCDKLKKALHLTTEAKMTITRAIERACEMTGDWAKEARSVVLKDAEYFGFTSSATV